MFKSSIYANISILLKTFFMAKILKRFLNELPIKIKTIKYSIREYLSSK